ncbi:MAG: hypothetical protein IJ306_08150 [Oscillospiraceae bacterium]|nr:hypothetical protein [Oscillospiraceae bacterium]
MRRYNINFGKITEGKFEFAPNPLVIGGRNYSTNDTELFRQEGYYPIRYSERPERNGYYYTAVYAQEGETIVQTWEEHVIPSEIEEDGA